LKRDFPGRATLLIVSDHGFSPIDRTLYPNVLLRKAGLIDVKGLRIAGGDVRLCFQGGAALVYLTADDDAARAKLVERVTNAIEGADGYAKVVPSEGLAAYGVGDAKQDPRNPDMILFADEGNVFGDTAAGELPFRDKPERKGSHGHDPNLPDLHATFIAWGAGIKPGATIGKISNTDVAPTIAKLLSIPMPAADGKVIEGVLR
jgi:predicted AlkP superfamily pyrophosphatase or phosphodiesterase